LLDLFRNVSADIQLKAEAIQITQKNSPNASLAESTTVAVLIAGLRL
jgi:hypothetical protein